jgi:HEPN domain-containing protein
MKEQTKTWLEYADENLQSANVLLESKLFNPCLQNVQQSIEKMLKAVLAESGIKIKKTHSINELVTLLAENGLEVNIKEDERDLIDSIYLPSKVSGRWCSAGFRTRCAHLEAMRGYSGPPKKFNSSSLVAR